MKILERKRKKRIIFIASSGGHLTEILQLKPLFKEYESFLLTERDVSTSSLCLENISVFFFPLVRRNRLHEYLFGNLKSMVLSFLYFYKLKPDVVLSTGAGICVYMAYLAKLFRKKVIFIETYAAINGKSGAGKLIYPIADRFYVQWENMKVFYPNSIYKGTLF